jgi:preprotein translocase subunit SecG
MLSIILIIGIIAAALMIVIVLIQNPKGGGLAANFSSSNQIFGVQRTSEGVEKLTWIFAALILFVSLAASSYNGQKSTTGPIKASNSDMEEQMNAPSPKPIAPNQATPNSSKQQ